MSLDVCGLSCSFVRSMWTQTQVINRAIGTATLMPIISLLGSKWNLLGVTKVWTVASFNCVGTRIVPHMLRGCTVASWGKRPFKRTCLHHFKQHIRTGSRHCLTTYAPDYDKRRLHQVASLGPEFKDALLVPPQLVGLVYHELDKLRFVARKWHQDGRRGSGIRAVGEGGPKSLRAIPLIKIGAQRITAYVQALARGAEEENTMITPTLQQLLTNREVELHQVASDVATRAPAREHRARGNHCYNTSNTYAPAKGAFTFAELFAGIGGFRVGLEALGGRCVFASEIEPRTVSMYALNFGNVPEIHGDIRSVGAHQVPPHDLLVAGFPCQPFSSLGLQPGISDRDKGTLFGEIVRILKARQPKAFLLENVPGLLQCQDGLAFSTILAALQGAGYHVTWDLINARCLTAQCRKRLYIVGMQHEGDTAGSNTTFRFPKLPELDLRAMDILMSEAELVSANTADNYTLSDEIFNRLQGQGQIKRSTFAWGDKVLDPLISHYSVSIWKGTSQLVPRPAPHNPRRFTPRECARLMGFPNDFLLARIEPGEELYSWSKTLYRMFGNAVCPPVVAALGGAILAHLSRSTGQYRGISRIPEGRAAAISLALKALSPHCYTSEGSDLCS